MFSIIHMLGTFFQAIRGLLVSLVTALLTKLSPDPAEPLVHDPSHTLFTYNCLHYAVITIDQPNTDKHKFDDVFSVFSELADRHIFSKPVRAHIALPGCCPNCQRLRKKHATFYDLDFRHRATQAINLLKTKLDESRTTLLRHGERYHKIDFLARVHLLKTRECKLVHSLFSSAHEPATLTPWTQISTNISLATHLLESATSDTKRIAHPINHARFSLTRISAQHHLINKGMKLLIMETNRLRVLEKKLWVLEKKMRTLDRKPKRCREGGGIELRKVAMRNARRAGWEGRMEVLGADEEGTWVVSTSSSVQRR